MPNKILIAEDSPTVLAMTKQCLEEAGFTVIAAEDGQEALDKAKREQPDLVVLDLMLPKIDGYKVCAMLKFDKTFKNTRVVIMSARDGEEDKRLREEVRADAYLVKPFDPESLLDKIRELLKEKSDNSV